MRFFEDKIVRIESDAKKTITAFLFAFPFFKPSYFMAFELYDDIFNLARVVSFALISAYYFFVRRKTSPLAVLIVVMQSFLLLNTYFQGGETYTCAKDIFPIVAIVLLYDILINDAIDAFVNSQLLCFEIVVYINLLTQIRYPGGMLFLKSAFHSVSNRWWFLGYYNTYTPYFIPAIVFALIYLHRTNLFIRPAALISAVLLSSLLAKSGGNALAIVLMFGVYLLFKNWSIIFNYYAYWLMQFGFYLLIIVMNAQNVFGWLLNDIMNKASSMKGRLLLWKRTINIIKRSPWIGYGVRSSIYRQHETRVGPWAIYAHNLLLEIMYQGGIVYLVLFCVLIIMAGNNMVRNRELRISQIISIGFLGWSVQSFVEAYRTPFLFGMFILAFYFDRLNANMNRKQIKIIF